MVFLETGEIHEISIRLFSCIENISVTDVSITNSLNFRRHLTPKQSLIEMKGLMLLEVILFDTEKFLSEHTKTSEIPPKYY